MSEKTMKQFHGIKKQKAFTLIELLVVIAIIALLLAIVMPSLSMAKEHAKRLICATHLKSIGQAIVLYADQENDELPMNLYQQDPGETGLQDRRDYITPMATYFLGGYDASVDGDSSAERLASMLEKDANGDERVTNLGYLISAGLLEDVAEVIYCNSKSNSDRAEEYTYDAYGGDADWPKGLPDTANPYSIRVSYSYLPQATREKHPDPAMSGFPNAAYKFSRMNPNLSVAMDLLQGENMSHRRGGYAGVNILYGGGHVIFRLDKGNIIKDSDNLIDLKRAVEFRSVIRELE